MRYLLYTFVALGTALMLAPAYANDAFQAGQEAAVQEASSKDRRARSNRSKSRAKSRSGRSDARASHSRSHATRSNSRSSRHSSHSARHHSSRHHSSRHHAHRRAPARVHHAYVRHTVVRPSHHRVYVRHARPRNVVVVHPSRPAHDRGPETVEVQRRADKAQRFSLGVGIGAVGSQTYDGHYFSNYGLDLQARYRVVDPLGLEVSIGYFNDFQRDAKRIDVPLQASAMLHTPGSWPVGAFVLAGVTVNYRDYDLSCYGGDHLRGGTAGPHVGAGLNLNLGPNVTLEWDVRYVHFLGETGFDARGTDRGNVSSSLAMNVFF